MRHVSQNNYKAKLVELKKIKRFGKELIILNNTVVLIWRANALYFVNYIFNLIMIKYKLKI